MELTDALRRFAQRVEGVLDRALPPASQPPQRLHEAMRYSVLGGGKRIRPMLAYAATVAFGAPVSNADAAAASVEIIHAYSLIHDDLPAMDDDELRRGKPTCHVAYDEATAILAGDALQALAFEVLAGATTSDATRVDMLRRLAAACGAEGMAGGQALDLAAVGQQLTLAELERMHAHKTGALIRASVALGALSSGRAFAGDPLLALLDRYSHSVGLAFQIRDDILDIEGETEVIGKHRGADAARDKPTYPAILGMDAARRHAEDQREEALAALDGALRIEKSLELDALRDLAHYAVDHRS